MKPCTCFNAAPDTGGTYCTKCSGSLLPVTFESVEKKEKLYGPISNLSIDKVLEASFIEEEQEELWNEVFDDLRINETSEDADHDKELMLKKYTITRKGKEG